jgi:hypothetical protein
MHLAMGSQCTDHHPSDPNFFEKSNILTHYSTLMLRKAKVTDAGPNHHLQLMMSYLTVSPGGEDLYDEPSFRHQVEPFGWTSQDRDLESYHRRYPDFHKFRGEYDPENLLDELHKLYQKCIL